MIGIALPSSSNVSIGDRFRERDPGRSIEDVDSPRRQADLQDPIIGGEVVFTDFEGRQRRAECGERLIDPSGIVWRRVDQNVDVLCSARMSVKRDCVAPHHDEGRAGVVELDE
jgi:hypothetical protein